jgi:hypothetical protein
LGPCSFSGTGLRGTRIFVGAAVDQFTNQIGGTIRVEASLLEVSHDPLTGLVRWISKVKANIPTGQEVLERPWDLGNQDVWDIIQFWNRIAKGILDQGYVVFISHVVFGLGHEVPGICPTLEVEADHGALLGELTRGHNDPSLISHG